MYLVSRLDLGTRLYLCVQWVDGRMKYQNTPITFFEKLDIFAEDYIVFSMKSNSKRQNKMIFNDKISMTIQLNNEYLLPVYHS